jgi:hypothetical protein
MIRHAGLGPLQPIVGAGGSDAVVGLCPSCVLPHGLSTSKPSSHVWQSWAFLHRGTYKSAGRNSNQDVLSTKEANLKHRACAFGG